MEAVILVIGLFFVKVAVVFYAWNAVIPDVLGLPRLDFGQAGWLFVLAGALFDHSGGKDDD